MPKRNRYFLGLFLAVLWPSVLMLCAEEPVPAPDATSSQNSVSPAPEAATPGIDNAVQMAQQEVRDPFAAAQPPEVVAPAGGAAGTSEEAATPIPVLQGIGFGSKDAYAVFDGEVFYNGDEKKGVKLFEVRRREVDILVNGGKMTVPLFKGEDLQKARDRAKKKDTMEDVSEDQPAEALPSLSGRERSLS